MWKRWGRSSISMASGGSTVQEDAARVRGWIRDGEEAPGGGRVDPGGAPGRAGPGARGSVGESLEPERQRGHPESAGSLNMSKGLFVALALSGLASTAAADASRVVTFMRQAVGFTDAQIASVEAGQGVAKQRPPPDKGGSAALGPARGPRDPAPFRPQGASAVGTA